MSGSLTHSHAGMPGPLTDQWEQEGAAFSLFSPGLDLCSASNRLGHQMSAWMKGQVE